MKKHLLTFVLLLLSYAAFTQTATDVQKAKAACIGYLKRNLNNPASYKTASWGKLIKTYSAFEDSRIYKVLNDSLEYYDKARNNVDRELRSIKSSAPLKYNNDSTYLYYIGFAKQLDSATGSIKNILIAKEKAFKPVLDGYILDHSFRARNKFNALVLQNYFFVLNKSLKVTSASDSDETERKREQLQREIDELTGAGK